LSDGDMPPMIIELTLKVNRAFSAGDCGIT
jgi:hypothetical protein